MDHAPIFSGRNTTSGPGGRKRLEPMQGIYIYIYRLIVDRGLAVQKVQPTRPIPTQDHFPTNIIMGILNFRHHDTDTDSAELEVVDDYSQNQKSFWQRIWPVAACGAGLFSVSR